MNKQEFVEALAEECDLSKADAGRALDAILDSLTQAMADGEEVRFTGFGTFSSQRRRARDGVNPQDPSKTIHIRAAHVPKFKPGTSLRAAASEDGAEASTGARTKAAPQADGQPGEERSGAAQSTASKRGRPQDWVPLGLRT